MDYEDMIDEEIEPTEPLPDEIAEELTAEPRQKSPWKAFILTGVIASLFGAAGGGYGVYEGVKRLGPKTAEAPAIDMSPWESKLNVLSARVSEAEATAKSAANRPAPTIEPVDLSGLESRLDTLESAPAPDIDPDALSSLKSAQADGFKWPDTSGLEDRISDLEAKAEAAPQPAELPVDVMERLQAIESDIKAKPKPDVSTAPAPMKAADRKRMDEIETRIAALETRPDPAPRIERVSLLPFPKAEMISAVEASVKGGIMKKMLSKHIRVKDDDDPIALIDAIEADLEQGRLEDALKQYDRLPEPARAAGRAWHDSVEASL